MPRHPPWHAQPLAALPAGSAAGLSSEQAAERLARLGPNRLPQPVAPPLLAVLLRQFVSPLIAVLLLAALLSLAVGDRKDALFIAAVLLLNALVGGLQEWRAERRSLSLHSRCLSGQQRQQLEQQLQPLLAEIHQAGVFVLRRGRMVLEVRPAILHTKADAVEWLEAAARRRGLWSADDLHGPLRFYFGDDETDEDVFRLWPGVIGVRVGPGASHTAATHRVSGPAGMARWLKGLPRRLSISG